LNPLPLFSGELATVLSVRQPFAYLIIAGHKRIENRTWATSYRGLLYIHAASRLHPAPMLGDREIEVNPAMLLMGGIIGAVELVDIVRESSSPWFEGPYGWVLRNPSPIPFVRLKGHQKLFQIPVRSLSASRRSLVGAPQY
jgi:hypothetical protein